MAGILPPVQLLDLFCYFICTLMLAKKQVDRKQTYSLPLMAGVGVGQPTI